jgi:hypothetical protein
MRVETYNPTTMSLVSSDVTGVDFGDIIRGKPSGNAVVIKPVATIESSFVELAMFLENSDGLNHTQFGKFKSDAAITGITPGSDYLSDFFMPITGISDVSMLSVYSDFGLLFNLDGGGLPYEYAWMDADADVSETSLGSSTVNFRFVFEYN